VEELSTLPGGNVEDNLLTRCGQPPLDMPPAPPVWTAVEFPVVVHSLPAPYQHRHNHLNSLILNRLHRRTLRNPHIHTPYVLLLQSIYTISTRQDADRPTRRPGKGDSAGFPACWMYSASSIFQVMVNPCNLLKKNKLRRINTALRGVDDEG
jgi:hypothetical protein